MVIVDSMMGLVVLGLTKVPSFPTQETRDIFCVASVVAVAGPWLDTLVTITRLVGVLVSTTCRGAGVSTDFSSAETTVSFTSGSFSPELMALV